MKTTKNFLIFFCLILNQNLNSVEELDRWKIVSENLESGTLFYVDSESIKRKNGFTYIWVLTNFPEKLEEEWYSGKSHWMIDCDLMRHKYLALYFFEKTFGHGKTQTVPEEVVSDKWNFPSPQSNGYNVLEYVCESN